MQKTSIRALVVDFGGVLTLPQDAESAAEILQVLGQGYAAFTQVYRSQRDGYDRGEITGEAYWAGILEHYGLEPEDGLVERLIHTDVRSWTRQNEAMIGFVREMKAAFHKLAIISNMTPYTLAYIREHFDWLALFDELVYSCELGVNKPERRIYEICLERLGLPAGACLFVDDAAENAVGAQRVGMHAILFRDFEQFLREFNEGYKPSL